MDTIPPLDLGTRRFIGGIQHCSKVTGETDAWETKDLVELVDAMDVMRRWFRVFKKKDIKKLKKEIHVQGKRKLWMKKMDEIFRPAIGHLKSTKLEL